MARNRRLDDALGGSNRSIWIATGIILLIGVVAVLWLTSPSERRRHDQMDRLSLGDPMGRVAEILGPPTVRCPAGDLTHFAGSFPPGWPSAATETTLQALQEQTRERWVYALAPEGTESCAPANARTEIGLDASGRILWYITITGESPIELPGQFTPAAPDEIE